jgi:diguanylate cyclase (GGDEF)-like protein
MANSLLNGVAATTTHRDRDELDRAVARLFFQFLQTHSITMLRLVPDGTIKRVEHRVRMTQQGEEQELTDVVRRSSLPALVDFPRWHECVALVKIVAFDAGDGRRTTIFPICGESDVVGILVLETDAPLSSREEDLVQGILGILRNHLALLDYGELDTLTGLLNRKTFEGCFEKLRERLIRPAPKVVQHLPENRSTEVQPCWLALIDIDHFKAINDGFGHLFGDEVLLLVSRLMRRSFRSGDLLFRFGGEEFLVLLEQASEPGAEMALERLRSMVEGYAFPQVCRVTISVGYTRINPEDVATLCVERADAALYYAKSHGRNHVRGCEALVAAGEIKRNVGNGEIELF